MNCKSCEHADAATCAIESGFTMTSCPCGCHRPRPARYAEPGVEPAAIPEAGL